MASHLAKAIKDTALSVRRRQSKFELRETRPVGARRERTGRSAYSVREERLRLTDERKQVRQESIWIRAFEYVDISRTNGVEVSDSHLPLVRASLPEENLARPNTSREGRSISNVGPGAYAQITRFEMLEPDHSLDAGRDRVLTGFLRKANYLAELYARPCSGALSHWRSPRVPAHQ